MDYVHSHDQRGLVQGIARPLWYKVAESEERLDWLKKMLGKKLLVRDLEAYASKVEDKLRSEDVKIKEDEKVIFLQLMELKLRDEKQCLRKLPV